MEIKHTLAAVVDGLEKVQDSLSSISTLSKGTSSGMGNLKLQLNHLRSEVVKSFNKVLNQVDSKATRVEVPQTELATAVQSSYFSLSKLTKKTYHSFEGIINTLNYFLADR
uniref:Uncharacterized protein n=1 Tax=Solanum lycopersicum TaxID=4081 RepID=A0A3Q7JVM3_SOLLC